MFEVFEHTADLGLRVLSPTREQLFREAARGLMSLIVTNLDDVRRVQAKPFRLKEADGDLLLFDWLSEVLYTFESERLVLVDFDVQLDTDGLSATGHGELLDMNRHQLEHEVKAITYHGLMLEPTAEGWHAEVIVDI